MPNNRGAFTGEFDFRNTRGYVLQVTAGIDFVNGVASWLLRAVDAETGLVINDPQIGLLRAGETARVGYTIQARSSEGTGAEIVAIPRAIVGSGVPLDGVPAVHTVDTIAPTSQLSVAATGAGHYRLQWLVGDDLQGSGVWFSTVYVSVDGGAFTVLLENTTVTEVEYDSPGGKLAQFIVLSVDQAGNVEASPDGVELPPYNLPLNLGTIPRAPTVAPPEPALALPEPAVPSSAMFLTLLDRIRTAASPSRPAGFTDVYEPFAGSGFVLGIPGSGAGVGALALAVSPDGNSLWVSGGAGRNVLWKFSRLGGVAAEPLMVLDQPIYDLVFDPAGGLWATTGGGALLQLNPSNGAIQKRFGSGIQLGLAVDAVHQRLFVSTTRGVEIFDLATQQFSAFSSSRVDGLALGTDGKLWGVEWPDRSQLIRFTDKGKAEVLYVFDTPADSLAFGRPGTVSDGLLFVSHNTGSLSVIELASRAVGAVAGGGTRGEGLRLDADGRIYLAQSDRVTELAPIVAPRIISVSPAPDAVVLPPVTSLSIYFDTDMQLGAGGVTSLSHYELVEAQSGLAVGLGGATYDGAQRRVRLNTLPLAPGVYELRVRATVSSERGVAMGTAYTTQFQVLNDLTAVLPLTFSNTRSDSVNQTVTFDLTLKNVLPYAVTAPVRVLFADLTASETGETPGLLDASGVTDEGVPYIEVELVPEGRLESGASRTRTITVVNPGLRVSDLRVRVVAAVPPNQLPVFTSSPVLAATQGSGYSYTVRANDSDGPSIRYVLAQGPAGASVDAVTGVLEWLPTRASGVRATFVVRAYDIRGGSAEQQWDVAIQGGNRAPELFVNSDYTVREGELLEIRPLAVDPDGDALTYAAVRLPPGAVFDSRDNVLRWTPGADAAGRYSELELLVTDGLTAVTRLFSVVVTDVNRAPVFDAPTVQTVREGETLFLELEATDPDGDVLTFRSPNLPPGASLVPSTGEFRWTPTFTQHGSVSVVILVDDGKITVNRSLRVTVLNVNSPVHFPSLGPVDVFEGQNIRLRLAALDADHPELVAGGGEDTQVEQGNRPSPIQYRITGLPEGATFDVATQLLVWTPGFNQAEEYRIGLEATDDGDGTGTPTTATATVLIRVRDANAQPTFEPIGLQRVDSGSTLELVVRATDTDGSPLSLSSAGLPSWASFADRGDGTGVLRAFPAASERGDFEVTLSVRDNGNGVPQQALIGTRTFILSARATNVAPVLEPIGTRVILLGETLRHTIRAADLDQDGLTFAVEGLPVGATLTSTGIYGQAELVWTPTAGALGNHTVTVRVTDSGNGAAASAQSDSETLTLKVRGNNAAPVLVPPATQLLSEGVTWKLLPIGTDADGDDLHWTAQGLIAGMTLSSTTGEMTWTPTLAQAGTYAVNLMVTDGSRTDERVVTLSVANTNRAPRFSAGTVFRVDEGLPLNFLLFPSDPDGDRLVLSSVGGLPAGVSLDAQTGEVAWAQDFDQAGEHALRFRATDPSGATGDVVIRVLVANVNRAPVLPALNSHVLRVGTEFRLVLNGTDPDTNSALRYVIQEAPAGMVLNAATGEVRWTPTAGQLGDRTYLVTLSDGDATVLRPLRLVVSSTPIPPNVRLELTPSSGALPGQRLQVQVLADGISTISTLGLKVDGVERSLDSLGRFVLVPTKPGRVELVGHATDDDGQSAEVTVDVKVRDPDDFAAPLLTLDVLDSDGRLNGPTSIQYSVVDRNLDEFRLEIAELGSNAWVALSSSIVPENSGRYVVDPAQWRNGFYQLRLVATDMTGRTSQTERIVEIQSVVKGGAFELVKPDLAAVLDGVPVSLNRFYSSLGIGSAGYFGSAWQLVGNLLNVQVLGQAVRDGAGVVETGLARGSRVMLDLPDGTRSAFTFSPSKVAGEGLNLFRAAWTPDSNVRYQLDTGTMLLSEIAGAYRLEATGALYDPFASAAVVTLTHGDGTRHDYVNARLQRVTLGTGQSVLWSDAGLLGSNGQRVDFGTDASGRIHRISGSGIGIPTVDYEYDALGRLITVSGGGVAQQSYRYSGGNLSGVLPSGGQMGQFIRYDVAGRFLGTEFVPAALVVSERIAAPTATVGLASGGKVRVALEVTQASQSGTASDRILLAVLVRGNGGAAPRLLSLDGGDVLVESESAEGRTTIISVDPGETTYLNLQNGLGGTAGQATVSVVVVGDVTRDGRVDGTDRQVLEAALGTTLGQPGFVPGADVNRDGLINEVDRDLLTQNRGWNGSRSPVLRSLTFPTHEGLAISVDLRSLVVAADRDVLRFELNEVQGGRAALGADGRTVLFEPTAGFTGAASFRVVAHDGILQSAAVTVTIPVSASPLLRIRFAESTARLDLGATRWVAVLGDFDDATGVTLPNGYLEFTSTDSTLLAVGRDGRVAGLLLGGAGIIASRGGFHAAMGYRIGATPAGSDSVLEARGLTVTPNTLAVGTGGDTRPLVVLHPDGTDLTLGSSGTRYLSSDDARVTVTADGLVTGRALGEAVVTVMHRSVLQTVMVQVVPIQTAPVLIGAGGGVVDTGSGTTVSIPAGALATPTAVSLALLSETELPYALLPGQKFAGGFRLGVGATTLAVPVTVSIPVPGAAIGAEVIFYRATQLPGLDGLPQDVWLQVAFGVVGADGEAQVRGGFPVQGIRNSGDYLVSETVAASVGSVLGRVTLANPIAATSLGFYFLVAPETGGGAAPANGARLHGPSFQGVAMALQGVVTVQAPVTPSAPVGAPSNQIQELLTFGYLDYVARMNPAKYQVFVIERTIDVAVPTFSSTIIDVQANQVATVRSEFRNTVLPADHSSQPPVVTSLTARPESFNNEIRSVFVIQVERLLWAEAPGGVGALLDDIRVLFEPMGAMVNSTTGRAPGTLEVSGNDLRYNAATKTLTVAVPRGLAVGAVQVRVERRQNEANAAMVVAGVQPVPVTVRSAAVSLTVPNRYVFSGLTSDNQLLVIDALAVTPAPVARIQVPFGTPRALALTPDLSRLYATLAGTSAVGIFDAVTFQPMDANPTTAGLDAIQLPAGAAPFWVAVGSANDFLFVSDERAGQVYVIDIRVGSSTYHEVVQTAAAAPAPSGLRGLAVDADGKRLYVAAPDSVMFGTGGRSRPGRILVFDIDDSNLATVLRPAAVIVGGNETYGVTAGFEPGQVVFTSRLTDGKGFGAIEALKAVFADVNLGSTTNDFDVNNAIGAAVLPDGRYAFITGYNQFLEGLPSHDPNIPPFRAGGNIGVIADPYGTPRLVAATVMVPNSFPDNLVLSPDGKRLFAAYRGGLDRGVYVYDVAEILRTVATQSVDDLERFPLDHLNSDVFIGRIETGTGRPVGMTSRVSVGGDLRVGEFSESEVQSDTDVEVKYRVLASDGVLARGVPWMERLYVVNDQGLKRLVAEAQYSEAGERRWKVRFPVLSTEGQGGSLSEDAVKSGLKWRVELDTGNALQESNEANNSGTGTIVLKLPDLEVSGIERPWLFFDNATRKFILLSETPTIRYVVRNTGAAPIAADVAWAEELWIGTDSDISVPNDISNGVWHLRVARLTGGPEFRGNFEVLGSRTRSVRLDLSKILIPAGIDSQKLEWVVEVDAVASAGDSTPSPAAQGAQLQSPALHDKAFPTSSKNRYVIQSGTATDPIGRKNDRESKPAPFGDTTPLRFEPIGSAWDTDDKTRTSTARGTIEIGFEPEAGKLFVPLLRVTNGEVVLQFVEKPTAENKGTISIRGVINPLIGNPAGNLGNLGSFAATMQIGKTTMAVSRIIGGSNFRMAGLKFSMSRGNDLGAIEFVLPNTKGAGATGEIRVSGFLELPKTFQGTGQTDVWLSGDNAVRMGPGGLTLNASVVTPGVGAEEGRLNPSFTFTLDGLRFQSDLVVLKYALKDVVTENPNMFFGGKFGMGAFGMAQVHLTEKTGYFLIRPDAGAGPPTVGWEGTAILPQIAINDIWVIQNMTLKLHQLPGNHWHALGDGKVTELPQAPQLKLSYTYDRGANDQEALGFKWTIERQSVDPWISVLGIRIREDIKVYFKGDRNPQEFPEWDPELQIAGKGDLPPQLVGEVKDVDKEFKITFADEDDKRLRINKDGVFPNKDNKPMTLKEKAGGRLFQNLKAEFIGTKLTFKREADPKNPGKFDYVAEFHGLIRLITIRETAEGNVERETVIDFSGDKNYVKFTSKGIIVVGEVRMSGPYYISKDGSWRLSEIVLRYDNSNPNVPTLNGSAKLTAPTSDGSKDPFELKVKLTPTQFSFSIAKKGQLLKFAILGFEVSVNGFEFDSDKDPKADPEWDPIMKLRGSITLPSKITGGKEVKVDIGTDPKSTDEIRVSRDGIEITGGHIRFNKEFIFKLFNKLEITSVDLDVAFVYTNDKKEASITGQFKIPSLGNLVVDLSGKDEKGNDRRIFVKDDSGTILIEANVQLTAEKLELTKPGAGGGDVWLLQKIQVDVLKPLKSATVTVKGKAELKSPDGDIAGLDFLFENLKLKEITLKTDDKKTVGVFGAKLNISYIHLIVDRKPDEGSDWDPVVELQGFLVLPERFGKAINATEIRADVTGKNKLIITSDGVEMTGGSVSIDKVDFRLFGQIDVHGESLKLSYKQAVKPDAANLVPAKPGEINYDLFDQFTINGVVTLTIRGTRVTVDFAEAAGNSVRIIRVNGQNKVILIGEIAVADIKIVPNVWELREARFKFNTEKDLYEGSAKLTFPGGVGVEVELGFSKGSLNKVTAAAMPFPNGIRIPLGTTGAFLRGLGGGVENIADPGKPLLFKGSALIVAGPDIAVPLPAWAGGPFNGAALAMRVDVEIDKKHFKGTARAIAVGDILTLTGLANGQLEIEIDWSSAHFQVSGTLAALGGLVTQTGNLTMDFNPGLVLKLGGSASVRLPSIDPIPKALQGRALAQSSALLYYRASGHSRTNFVAGAGTYDFPTFTVAGRTIGGVQVLGVVARFDGDFDWMFNYPAGIVGAASIARLLDAGLADGDAVGAFEIVPGTDWVLLGANWENPTTAVVPLIVELPDGSQINESEFAAHNMAVVDSLTSASGKSVFVAAPQVGRYRLLVPQGDLGNVEFDAIRDVGPSPTLQVTNPSANTSSDRVSLQFQAAGASPDSLVYFFYDTDDAGFDGVPLGDAVAVGAGNGSVEWDLQDVPSGNYRIYAVLMDGVHAPVYSNYAAGRIQRANGPVRPIRGSIFEDLNGNGLRDAADPGAAGRTVFLDSNVNGILNDGERRVVTGADGLFEFLVESPNAYSVVVLPPVGGILTTTVDETGGLVVTVTAVSGVEGLEFGVARLAVVRGSIFIDENRDGIRGVTETGIGSVTVFADRNGNQKLDASETSTVTNETGNYILSGNLPGAVTIRVIDGVLSETIAVPVDLVSGGTTDGVDLVRVVLGRIQGSVYVDNNLNGVREGAELGMAHVTVYLDQNRNGILDPEDRSVLTDATGAYGFDGLVPGTYDVRQVEPIDYGQTAPALGGARTVILAATGGVHAADFGNRPPGFYNGSFDITDPANALHGWALDGAAQISRGSGLLLGGTELISGLAQTFELMPGANRLRVTLGRFELRAGSGVMAPAFEITLVDAITGASLIATPSNLSQTNAGVNLQSDLKAYFGSGAVVPGAAQSGGTAGTTLPTTLEIPLLPTETGTQVRLQFALIHGGSADAVAINEVQFVSGVPLSVVLSADSDTGFLGDRLTYLNVVNLQGNSFAGVPVVLDLDDDGFDDGSVVADAQGVFRFVNVLLQDGVNQVRVQVGVGGSATIADQTIVVDRVAPRWTGWMIQEGAAQRSMVTQVRVTFDDTVYSGAAGMTLFLTNRITGVPVSAATAVLVGHGTGSWVWTFPSLTGGSLADGIYLAELDAETITDAAGNRVFLGAGTTSTFHRLFGDVDGDRDVDFLDTFHYQRALNTSSGQNGFDRWFDVDSNGVIHGPDQVAFQKNYLTRLQLPARPTGLVTAARPVISDSPGMSVAAARPESFGLTAPLLETRFASSVQNPSSYQARSEALVNRDAAIRGTRSSEATPIEVWMMPDRLSHWRSQRSGPLTWLKGADLAGFTLDDTD